MPQRSPRKLCRRAWFGSVATGAGGGPQAGDVDRRKRQISRAAELSLVDHVHGLDAGSSPSLTEHDADITIGHVRPDWQDLIAWHLGDFRANLHAASARLHRTGRPRTPREIAVHDFVGNADPQRLMARLHNMGVPVRAESSVISCANGVVAWGLVNAG